jgi:hypothetical protein
VVQFEDVAASFCGVSLLSWKLWSGACGSDETFGWAGTEPEGSACLILTTSENGAAPSSSMAATSRLVAAKLIRTGDVEIRDGSM